MSKYAWNGNVLTVDLEDGKPAVVVDAAKFADAIKSKAFQLGVQTKVRNFTAGKMDDAAKGRTAMEEGVKELFGGNWGTEKQAAVELSDAERTEVVNTYLVEAKRAVGDKRPAPEIVASFRKLPTEQQAAILKKHERNINKRLKAALNVKKGKGISKEGLEY
jgi:uncharacterized protein HemY